ncbi:MAG: T9SS type A sorting domain-containing protein [Crocinitomicaceae bacterium]|nr:T9SS type A sorting domain-containing protein [Crocinitomicaceae bacterium]MDP5010324.1 T9SS type A sorting domain-containing protein [Crocinitomicaceae bacterium]
MKKLLLSITTCLIGIISANAQCTTTNATSCVCEDGSNNCYLLPDITASWKGISNNGFIEYPQTNAGTNYAGQGPDDGRLRVSGSTPNIGHGSFTVRGLDVNGKRAFVCGTDTVFNVNAGGAFTCPNGDPNPRQLVIQRVYKKEGNVMSYTDFWSGSMTYHPSHGHNHVDDWAVMTLRVQTADPNPLNWPILGDGAKIGFCLMDYGQCGNTGTTYDGHCRDENTVYLGGNTLHNGDFPNWNLGGGNYNCSTTEQGISSGWTDVYGKHLDGMWINLPKNVCNGDYYIVLEVDKNNDFMEENEDNNFTAVPVTLTMQNPAGSGQAPLIWANGTTNICGNNSVSLSATGGSAFLWSNGETTQTINVTQPGSYTCTVTNYCGTSTSEPFIVNEVQVNTPVVTGDTVCVEGIMDLAASSTGSLNWFDAQGNLVGTGGTFTTPLLNTTTTYYVQNTDTYQDTIFSEPHTNGIGGGGFVSSEQYELFDTYTPIDIKSTLVYSQGAGSITIELVDGGLNVLGTVTTTVPAGESRIDLNFNVPVGYNFRLVGKNITTGGLYRNNNSASYPYMIDNVMKITGASAGASYYYFFYDLEVVASNGTCPSDLVPVQAVVESCLGIGENIPFKNSMKIAPNPNNGNFSVMFNANNKADVELELVSLIGTKVYSKKIEQAQGEVTYDINVSSLSKGVYLFNVIYEGKPYTQKIIID